MTSLVRIVSHVSICLLVVSAIAAETQQSSRVVIVEALNEAPDYAEMPAWLIEGVLFKNPARELNSRASRFLGADLVEVQIPADKEGYRSTKQLKVVRLAIRIDHRTNPELLRLISSKTKLTLIGWRPQRVGHFDRHQIGQSPSPNR